MTELPSALTPLQVEVIGLFFSLPASDGFLLAGGAALVAHGLSDRPTQDLDFFTSPGEGDVPGAQEGFKTAARGRGWTVDTIQASAMFCRMVVHAGEDLLVDLALDSALTQPLTMTVLGPSLSAPELAGRKTLALFDRAAARDFVDVYRLAQRFDRTMLLDQAAQIDRGFDRVHFAAQLLLISRYRDADMPIPSGEIPEVRRYFAEWASQLTAM